MWIKICGITSKADAHSVRSAGGNAIGLNFYEKSSRCIAPEMAVKITEEVRSSLEVVGVFVNSSPDDVAALCDRIGLTAVQFHGDETPQQVAEFQALRPDVAVVRALRIGEGTTGLSDQMQPWLKLSRPLDAFLVDAFVAGEYGGTGRTIDPQQLQDQPASVNVILAGGLRPDNVAEAIEVVRPWGVDTAGGVEIQPGRKSDVLIRQFVQACRSHKGSGTRDRLGRR